LASIGTAYGSENAKRSAVSGGRRDYTAVHNGKKQPFLDHFHYPERYGSRVILDTVQPELGSKFLKKWNRNIVLEAPTLSDYSHPMFRWVPLQALTQLMKLDHIVNNDARLVRLQVVQFADPLVPANQLPIALANGAVRSRSVTIVRKVPEQLVSPQRLLSGRLQMIDE
jgi:hypothetical protein